MCSSGVSASLLLFLGHFSVSQSVVLTAMLLTIVFSQRSLQPKRHFLPFCVSIQPNWSRLLQDQGVIKDDAEWRAIFAAIKKSDSFKTGVFNTGIFFTILGDAPTIIHHAGYFKSSFEFQEPLGTVVLDAIRQCERHRRTK